jgi:hypothetical protein
LIPGRLRVVDIDFDGFIDILFTVTNPDLTNTTIVLANVPGNSTAGGASR